MTGNRKITPTWRGWKVTFTQKGQKEYIHSRPAYGVEKKLLKVVNTRKGYLTGGATPLPPSSDVGTLEEDNDGCWWWSSKCSSSWPSSLLCWARTTTLWVRNKKTKTKLLQELMPPKEVWLGSIVWRRIFFVFSAIFFSLTR